MAYQDPRTFKLPEGAVALSSPQQIPQYRILGQVGATGTPGSFLYGVPKEQQADSRQLPPIQSQPLNAPQIQAQQQGQTFDRNKILQDTIAAMLKAAQVAGDEDLVAKRNAIIQARFNAQRQATPEELRVLAPSQQASLRGLDVSGLEEQLGGVSTALTGREKKRTAQIQAAKDLFNVLLEQQKAEEKAPETVGSAGTGYKQYNPKTKSWEEIIKPETLIGGLTPSQVNSTVNAIAGSFDNEQIVKSYNVAQEGYQTISSIGTKTSSPADDIAFIYAFAKIMDPNSVVREGEYNTIQRYAQTWADNFGFKVTRIFSNTNFLTPDAKQKMLNALKPKVDTLTKQYENLKKEYQRQINDAYAGKPRTITSYGVQGQGSNDEFKW